MDFSRGEAWLPSGPISTQHGRDLLAGVEENAGDVNAIHVGGGDGRCTVDGAQGGKTKADDKRIGPGDANRLGEVVNAGREQQVLSLGKLRVHGGGGIFIGVCDIELAEGNRCARA